MAIRVGEKLKRRYEVRALLGQGEHGKTWKAWDTRSLPPKLCVIKEPVGPPSAIKELENESAAAGLLHHKNIVPVLEFNHDEGFLVEEYVQGRSLQSELRDQARKGSWLPNEKGLEVFTQVLEGLEYAHEKNRIHGDVKPGNIMLPEVGEARLTDFGVSRFFSGGSVSGGAPWDRSRVGSASCSAPEVLLHKQWSFQSDLFSVGVVAYLLFWGRHPFVDMTGLWTTTERIIDPSVNPAPVREVGAEVDTRIEKVISRLLQREIGKRYQTARDALDDLIGGRPPANTCPYCGNDNPAPARFCNACGKTIAEVELAETEPDGQLGLSFSLFRAGDAEGAIQLVKRLVAAHPEYGKGWAHLAFMLNQLRRYEEALEAADKAIKYSPDFSNGHRNKGFALSCLRRFEDAVEQFDLALDREQRPRDRGQILYNKVYALMLDGRSDDAKQVAEGALREDPTNYRVLKLLSRLESTE